MVWTVVEVGVAITAASLVTIRPLLRVLKFNGFGSAGENFSTSASNNNPRSMGQNVGQDEDTFHLGNWAALTSITSGSGKSEQNARAQGNNDAAAASEEYILQGTSAERNDSDGVMWTRTVNISIEPRSRGLE